MYPDSNISILKDNPIKMGRRPEKILQKYL